MNDQGTFTTWVRVALAAILATSLGIALNSSATAVELADPAGVDIFTGFEIDGNKGTDGTNESGTGVAFDWDDAINGTVGPYSFTNGGVTYRSAGVVASAFNTDVQPPACGGTANEDGFGGGAKIDDNPWNVITTNVNSKSDACSGATAVELVRVTDPGAGTDQIHYILYTYWSRSQVATGDMTVYQVFAGTNPDPNHRCDDLLFEFNYNPSSGIGDITSLEWSGDCTGAGTWTPTSTAAVSAAVTGANVDPADVGLPTANDDTFGESAIDLTASGVLPEDECTGFTTAGYVTRTGNSQTGSTIDFFGFDDPIVINTCADVQISKQANVAGASDLFTYVLDQEDGQPVHDGSVSVTGGGSDTNGSTAAIASQIGVGDTHIWSGVIAQPDYDLSETVVPDGWAMVDITCSYYDPFTGQSRVDQIDPEQSDFAGDDSPDTFLIPPVLANNGQTTSCVITNQTSGLVVEKAGSGDPAQEFDFAVTGQPGFALGLGGVSDTFTYTPGSSVTVSETLPTTTPGWSLDSIACVDDQGGAVAPTGGAANSVVVDTVGGTVITCTFTNTQAGRIDVVKAGAPTAGGPFGFDASWDPAFPDLSIGDSNNSGDLAPGDYTVSELLDATNAVADPDYVGSALCSTTVVGSGASSSSAVGVDASITLGAGDIVTCTFTNTQNGRIVVEKTTINGDDTFTFTGDVAGSITTSAGVGTTTLSDDLAPGTYDVAETPTPGYTLTASSCDDGSDVDSIGLAAGEIVTCSFENTRNQASFTLDKEWVNPIAGDAVDLDADGSDANSEIIDTSSNAPVSAGDTMVVYSGETVDFSEAFTAGSADNYITTLVCSDASGELVNNTGQLAGQLAIADDPTDITCSFTNTRKTSSLVLQKEWIDGNAGDTAVLDADNVSATSTATGAAGSELDGTNQATITTVFVGETIELSETLSAPADYNTSLSCVGGSLTYGAGDVTGSVDVLPADENTQIVCTFTNTRKRANLVLTKSWADSPATTDMVSLTITGGDAAPVAGSSVADRTVADDASSVVYAGETLGVAEVFGSGLAGNYDAALDCGGHAVSYTAGDLSGSITIEPADEGTTITCSFTNTRKRTTLTLEKEWVNPFAGDTADLAADATNDDSDTAVAPSASGASAETADITVYAGESVALSEVLGAVNVGSYDVSAFSCTAGTANPAWAVGDSSLTLDVVAADVVAPITCTMQNTRREATFTLAKIWDDPVGGASLTLHAQGDDPNLAGSVTEPLTSPTGGSGSMTVYSGETISFDETFGDAADVARFATTLECGGQSTAFTPDGAALDVTFGVGADPVDTTCTFTNVRKSTDLELRKAWVNSAALDSYDLSIEATEGAGPVAATAPGGTGASAEFATIVVYAGETATLNEAAGVNVGSYDVTALTCTAGQTTWTLGSTTGGVSVDAADIAVDPIVCTFTNSRTSARLTVEKLWDDPAGGATVALAAAGSDPDVGGSVAGSSISPTPFSESMTVYSGETVAVSENFTAGDPANYDSSLSCSNGTTGDYGGSVDIPADPVDVTCTFVNTRLRTELTLEKTWVGAVLGDDAALAIGATDSDGPVSATAPDGDGTSAQSASITVYAGETVTLGETIDPNGTNVALYDATAFSCTAGTPNPAWTTGATSLSLDVAAADVAAPIGCTVENTARRGDILIIKAIDGEGAEFGFLGSWLDPSEFSLIPPADGSDQQLFEDVLVPKDGSTYSVVEVDPGSLYGTTVQCTDGVAGGNPSLPGAPTPGLQGTIGLDNDELVTCTFNNTQNGIVTIVKEALPELVQDFAFSSDFGPFTLDDDGAGDNFVVFDNVVPGSYAVTEAGVPGWDLTNLVCVETTTNSTVDLASATATINVDPAEAITCTFTNAAQPGEVSVTKSVTGVDDSLVWSFDFSIDPVAAPSATQTASGVGTVTSSAVTWTDLVPGTVYTISETAVPGWTAGLVECTVTHADQSTTELTAASFTVAPGDSISCDFDNAAQPGEVSVTKSVTGVDDSLVWSFDFSIDPVAAPSATQTASGVGTVTSSAVTWTDLVPGTVYTISETAVPGWTAGLVECTVTHADQSTTELTAASFTVAPGDSISCDFDNAADPGSITVTKNTEGGDGVFTFAVAADGGPPTDLVIDTAVDPVGALDGLVPGTTYSVVELDPGSAWIAGELACAVIHADGSSESYDAAGFTVLPGDVISCEITNVAKGTIIVEKLVEGDGAIFEFSGTWLDLLDFTVDATTGVGQNTYVDIDPGTYTVAETDPSPDYDGTNLVCVDGAAAGTASSVAGLTGTIELDAGETVTCTYTNTQRGAIIVDKVTQPAADTTAFDFELSGDATDSFTVSGPGTPHNTGLIAPGTYTVTELAEAGWVFQGADCDSDGSAVVGASATVTVAPGEVVTCTFTNARRGPLTITKTVTDGPTRVDVNTYELTYQVAVASESYVDEGYDLADEIQFGDGVTVLDASATGPAGVTLLTGWDGLGNTLLVDDGTLGPLATQVFTISVTGRVDSESTATSRDCVLGTGETGTGFLNSATVTFEGGTDTDDDCGEAPGPEDADLAIVKSANVSQIGAGGGFDWILDVTNAGPGTAVGVVIGDVIPSVFSVTGVTSPDFACRNSGNTVSCTVASMAVGATGQIVVSVTVPSNAAGGAVTNVGTVESDTPDPDLTNNSDDASVVIVAQAAPTTTLPPVILPTTGTDATSNVVRLALLLIAAGVVVLVVSRRRDDVAA